MATPFVQGQLLDKDLSCTVDSKCAISGRQIVFEVDSNLCISPRTPDDPPMLFIPMIDLTDLDAQCIVDDF